MKLTAADRLRAIAASGRVACNTEVANLRAAADGPTLGDAERTDMLARAVNREMVSLYLDVLAYEQSPGAPNRKGVRVRDNAMSAFARSGRGAPFMRDHLQGDSLAKGGEIVDARSFADDSGRRGVTMTVHLMEPTAVERALRGLMKSVSVGMTGGAVHCTACGAEVLTQCWHLPLDVVEGADGQKMTAEWEWQDPQLIETSEVAIPAVPGARVRGEVRAALGMTADDPGTVLDESGAAAPSDEKIPAPDLGACAPDCGLLPPEETKMPDPKDPTIHTDPAAVAAAAKAAEELERTQAELAIASAEQERHLKELAGYRETARQAEEDRFIESAKLAGRIAPADEEAWRHLFRANKDRAEELMSKRPVGCSTPVGTARQHAAVTPPRKRKPAPVEGSRWVSDRQRRDVLRSGMTEEQYNAALAKYDALHAGVDGEAN